MSEKQFSNKIAVIIGAGPAGLAAAITLKNKQPQTEICVIDKATEPGNHNLSGAILEPECLDMLLSAVDKDWKQSEQAKEILAY